ncbi:MAG: hypothetical protein R2713_11555 [Ilumatobacteraceae bacterium]
MAFTHPGPRGQGPVARRHGRRSGRTARQPAAHRAGGRPPLLPPNTTFRHLGQRQPTSATTGGSSRLHQRAVSDEVVPDWEPAGRRWQATSQVYVWDRFATDPALAVTVVSALDGLPAEWGAESPAISGNGQFVAFQSPSPEVGRRGSPPRLRWHLPAAGVSPRPGGGHAGPGQPRDHRPRRAAGGSRRRCGAAHHLRRPAPRSVSSPGRRNLFLVSSAAGTSPTDGDVVVSEVDRGIVRRASTGPNPVTPAPGGAHPHCPAAGTSSCSTR